MQTVLLYLGLRLFLIYVRIFLHRFAGDVAELGIIRAGSFMTVKVVLNPRVHLVMPLGAYVFAIFLCLDASLNFSYYVLD